MALVTAASPSMDADDLGDLAALAGVREFPGRVKCATLAVARPEIGTEDVSRT